ncbi:MAG: YfhO family protein ['Candidatus Kapabacteria' thiocyanatum]|uniref:Membrane protein 6-pyruvoyl-tetrahydropterin synthase-related domain-containing protein n=1 Tax=Candidatus Kapaibacterium thiocyanatum TaxID=1895771 RepID=A0A1M3KWB0_9BACT|nr:YfhO family protein ['Candidatus Kapabacteria' thiocyanatum]OJX56655.1 MAG: hypothetical protein BGO89_08900 ['Candidatus Kapabacteria' thiocyanatum]
MNFIPERYRDLAAYGVILLAVILFFADALFGGKTFLGESDNVAFFSFIPYLDQAKQSGEFPLWVPYIFSGMPSLASFLAAGERGWDIVAQILFAIPRTLGEVMNNDTARIGLWYSIYGWGVYTLMRAKKHLRGVSIFSALGAVFSTFVIVWIMIGHSTKPVSLATLPWILLALERLRERFSLLNLFILTLPLIVLVSATHPQMMFYIGCGLAIYMLVELVHRLITKDGAMDVLKSAGALAVAGGLALATHADMFLATREYTPYSTRGSAPLVQNTSNQQDRSGGNDYEYATNWSFSPEEMMTFLVPNYYGFGKTKDERGRMEMTYWGQMPFTDAANYMGIGILMLALVGAWANRRDPFVVFLIVVSVFSLLLSFGKNFPILYDIFYNLVPSFNKFRAPSIALCLLQFAVPVLAGYGLTSIIGWSTKATAQQKKTGLALLGGAAAFFIVGVIYTNTFESSYKRSIGEAYMAKMPDRVTDPSQLPDEMTSKLFDSMQSDWMVTGLLAIGFGLLAFLTIRGTIKPGLSTSALIVLLIIDLWRVDKRPYEPSKAKIEQTTFRRTDVVDFLKQDKGAFRIADLSRNAPNAWAYHFIENVHGYSSAKLRVYQDMLDIAGVSPGSKPMPGNSLIVNPFMWNLLNVKYIVADQPIYQNVPPAFTSQQTGQLVYDNPMALPRAWFVDSTVVGTSDRVVLEAMRDAAFNPRQRAYVSKAVNGVVAADSTASVRITGRGNQHLAFDVKASGDNFLVVSEVYYPEWHAYVDGKEVEIVRTNTLLRGVRIPAGSHTLEFRFISPAFESGRTISMAANGIILAIGALGLLLTLRDRKRIATGKAA